MKKILNISIFLLGFLIVLNSCEKKEFTTLNPNANTIISLSSNNIVLTDNTAANDAVTISWTKPDFGFEAAPSYAILFDLAGGDFSAAQVVPVGNELEKTFTEGELNGKLLALGVAPNIATNISVMVRTKLSNSTSFDSEPVTLNVTAYSSILDLSTNWGVVGSATPGGWGNPDIPDLPFYQTSTPGNLVAYVTLKAGEIKFRQDNSWTVNLGDTGADGTLEPSGDNIVVNAGTYKIDFDVTNSTYTMTPYTWGLVGDATANGWGGPDFMLHYNPYNNNWKAAVTLSAGEIKFRLNNDWGTNYGDTGADGTLENGGDNIAVAAGNYIVTFDLENLTYQLEATDLWGLVGDATPNGWGGPDTKFTPDFGLNEDTWYINGITLSTGDIKVRQNDDWGLNYGDTGNDGTLEAGGDNIPVTAGTYNIKIVISATTQTINIYPWQ
jgi:hypothetical protein